MPTRNELEKLATQLLNKLYGEEELETESEEEDDVKVSTADTWAESLQADIEKGTNPITTNTPPTKKSLQAEMALFEATNVMGKNLEKLFLVLKNIAPTSVASEQAFSISGNFVTKLRSQLSDGSIDDLCFEKGYFAKEGLYK